MGYLVGCNFCEAGLPSEVGFLADLVRWLAAWLGGFVRWLAAWLAG
jgi:hypothetical protein